DALAPARVYADRNRLWIAPKLLGILLSNRHELSRNYRIIQFAEYLDKQDTGTRAHTDYSTIGPEPGDVTADLEGDIGEKDREVCQPATRNHLLVYLAWELS